MATVLIIDDEASIRELFQKVLSDSGFDVLTAEDGETGFALWQHKVIQVVVLDYRMPGMKGEQVLKQMRAEDPDVKVVVVTATPPQERIFGASALIHKPLGNIVDLATVVKSVAATFGP